MLHYTVELEDHSQTLAEIANQEHAIVFRQAGEEFFRLSFAEFDQILEAVARGENFALSLTEPEHGQTQKSS